MTAIIVCCHATLAQGFAGAVELITGKQDDFFILDFQPGQGLEELISRITDCINQCGTDQALIFTDLYGASPANAASAALFSVNAETVVITGANLAAVLEATLSRDSGLTLEELAAHACQSGRDNLQVISKKTVENAGGSKS